jgi:hypothetical protein
MKRMVLPIWRFALMFDVVEENRLIRTHFSAKTVSTIPTWDGLMLVWTYAFGFAD